MILVVTSNLTHEQCREALRECIDEEIVLAASLHEATSLLRIDSFTVVVLDEYLLETEQNDAATAMRHLGTAIPLRINFAVCGEGRLVREVRAGLQRRRTEQRAAQQAALKSLRYELNGTVTSLLLSCELALNVPGLPESAAEQVRSAHTLVQKLRTQLESALADPPALQKAACSARASGVQAHAERPA